MYEDQAEAKMADRAPGAVDTLRQTVERLHHQISTLYDVLQPVLRPDSPLASVESTPGPSPSAIETELFGLDNAVERLIQLRNRLAV